MNLLRRFAPVIGMLAARHERTLIRRIRRASARLDAFDAIANLSLSVSPIAGHPGKLDDSDGLMAIPEFAAPIFAEQSTRCFAKGARKGRLLSTVHSLIPSALQAANMRILVSLAKTSQQAKLPGRVVPRLTHAAISREMFLRFPRFHDKEMELLRELFTGDARQPLIGCADGEGF